MMEGSFQVYVGGVCRHKPWPLWLPTAIKIQVLLTQKANCSSGTSYSLRNTRSNMRTALLESARPVPQPCWIPCSYRAWLPLKNKCLYDVHLKRMISINPITVLAQYMDLRHDCILNKFWVLYFLHWSTTVCRAARRDTSILCMCEILCQFPSLYFPQSDQFRFDI